MNRLLQGDVGSGKTLVAAAAIWFAAQNGWQSAMLAPTEILARQHAVTLADRLEPFGVNVTLLVGGMKAKEKRIALEAIADGRANLVVGTHAVLTDTVEFKISVSPLWTSSTVSVCGSAACWRARPKARTCWS